LNLISEKPLKFKKTVRRKTFARKLDEKDSVVITDLIGIPISTPSD
jgi:hypothetical protein